MKRILQGIFWIFLYIFPYHSASICIADWADSAWQGILEGVFRCTRLCRPFHDGFAVCFNRSFQILESALRQRYCVLLSPANFNSHFALILIHPILLFIFDAEYIKLLNIFTSPWRAKFAVISTLALVGLVFLSIYRKRLKTLYEHWRILHGSLAILAMMGGMLHILGVNHYLSVTWKRYFWIVYITFWVGLLVWTRLLKPWLEMRRPYEITSIQAMRGNVNVLTIKPSGHSGIRFLPGQFVWIVHTLKPFSG